MRLTYSKFGRCNRCMVASLLITLISIITLLASLEKNLNPLILPSSITLGASATILSLHIIAHTLRSKRKQHP